MIERSACGQIVKQKAFTASCMLLLLTFLLSAQICFALPAFPGAEGFGSQTTGGRGGKVYLITNLNDSGPGSLRECIEASGPRIAIFKTGGTISLNSTLTISNPYITIAGQSAPGGGITLKGNGRTGIRVKTHDVVIRYLTVRVGSGGQTEGIAIYDLDGNVNNVIVDHCSVSWATDEVLQTWYNARNITLQWNIISEGLDCSTHPKGCHSKGMMFGSENSNNLSFHHNLLAHNVERNPLAKTPGPVDITNNVFYNSKDIPALAWDAYGKTYLNFIGNYHKLGPNSRTDTLGKYSIRLVNAETSGAGYSIYFSGNIGPLRSNNSMDQLSLVRVDSSVKSGWNSSSKINTAQITFTDAFAAYEQVLDSAGNSVGLNADGTPFDRRDAIDQRVVLDVKNGTGRIINNQSEVGGWVSIAQGIASKDSDNDGMPDQWELRNGLNPNDATDNVKDRNGDGYTNIEDYLNQVDRSDNVSAPEICPPTSLRVVAEN